MDEKTEATEVNAFTRCFRNGMPLICCYIFIHSINNEQLLLAKHWEYKKETKIDTEITRLHSLLYPISKMG